MSSGSKREGTGVRCAGEADLLIWRASGEECSRSGLSPQHVLWGQRDRGHLLMGVLRKALTHTSLSLSFCKVETLGRALWYSGLNCSL